MASSLTGLRTSSIVYTTIGIATVSFLGYAVYFDYQRRNNPDFRKSLKKESRKQAKVAKAQAEQGIKKEREEIHQLVDEANAEGFPAAAEEKEALFMQEVGNGEQLCNDPSLAKEAALSFYKALKVYPQQSELMKIYDKTVPKPVLDIVAEMIAYDHHKSGESNPAADLE